VHSNSIVFPESKVRPFHIGRPGQQVGATSYPDDLGPYGRGLSTSRKDDLPRSVQKAPGARREIKGRGEPPQAGGETPGEAALERQTGFASDAAIRSTEIQELCDFSKILFSDSEIPDSTQKRLRACYSQPRIDRNSSGVVRQYRDKGGKCYFSGLMHCGLIWVCLRCALIVSERRRKEIAFAVNTNRARGGSEALVTLTFPHYANDNLDVLRRLFQKALRRFKSGRKYHELAKGISLFGEVRNIEVTNGRNGWHPHSHAILFFGRRLTDAEQEMLRAVLTQRWIKTARSQGLRSPSIEHGLEIEFNQDVSSYLTKCKWGIDKELTGTYAKKSKRRGRTIFQLLLDAKNGDKRAGRLCIEFALAFRGTKQLHWSKGLKQALLITEKTEEEILLEATLERSSQISESKAPVLVCVYRLDEWKVIRKARIQKRLLEIGERRGFQGILELVESLCGFKLWYRPEG
jgi:hypothetical protein